jgi:hypothetical protein
VSEASGILTRRLGPPLLLALGVAGLVLGGVAGAQLRRATPFGPPLVSPSGLAVDREGRVYAGTDVDRIHVYDIDGRFLRGWYLDSEAGPVRLRIDAADHIEVATARSGRLHVFDRDGQLVRTQPDSAAFQRFGATQERVAEGAGGTRVVLEDGALIRTAPTPRQVLAPAVSPPLTWFAAAPLPALTVLLMSSVIALLVGLVLSLGRRGLDPEPSRPAAR